MNGGGGAVAGPSTHPTSPRGTERRQSNPFLLSTASAAFPAKQKSTPPHHVSPPLANLGAKTYTADEVWLSGRERLRPTPKLCAIRIDDQACNAELISDALHANHLRKHLDKIGTMVAEDPQVRPQVWIGSVRVRWDDVEELRDAFDNHAYRNSLCAVKDCPHPHLIRPESHYKNSHDPSDFRDELLRPSLVLEPGKLPELPPLPKSLPAYLVTTHEIRPFQDRPLPAIPTPGPRLRELREPILEIRDVDDVPAMRPAALWDSSDFATMELEDDEEGTVIGEVNGAPVIRLSAPPPTPLQGGRKRKRGERASSVLSDASWAPSVAPSSPGSVRMGPPPLRASGSQPIIREETPFSIRDETPTPSTPKRALRQTPSAEQPIVIQPPARKRSKPIFAKNRILLSTVTLPDGPVLVASAGARGAQPMRLIKRTGKPREIPQPLDYILDRAEKAHKAKEAAAAVKTEVKLEPGSASPAPPSSMPSQATATQTQVGSSQASLPGPSQLSQSSQPLSASQAMLPPTQPRRGRRAAKAAVRDDDHVISRAAEDWAFAKTGRYCGISFWEHKMAFETAVAQRRLEKNMADLVGPPLPSNPQPSQVRTTASKPSL